MKFKRHLPFTNNFLLNFSYRDRVFKLNLKNISLTGCEVSKEPNQLLNSSRCFECLLFKMKLSLSIKLFKNLTQQKTTFVSTQSRKFVFSGKFRNNLKLFQAMECINFHTIVL